MGVLTCIYTAAILWAGKDTWQIMLSGPHAKVLLLVVALISLNISIRAVRFYYFQHLVGWRIPLFTCLSAFVASLALTATPGKMGELVKIALLRSRYQISLSEGVSIHIIERFLDLMVIVVFAAVGLYVFTDFKTYFFGSVAIIAILSLLLFPPALHRALIARVVRIPYFKIFTPRLTAMSSTFVVLLKPIPLFVGGALSLVAWSCEAAALYFLVGLLDIQSSLTTLISIYGLATLAGALSMLPGGIGGFEIAMGALLFQIGASSSAASMAVASFRVSTLWLSSIIGLAFLIGWMGAFSRRAGQANSSGTTPLLPLEGPMLD